MHTLFSKSLSLSNIPAKTIFSSASIFKEMSSEKVLYVCTNSLPVPLHHMLLLLYLNVVLMMWAVLSVV